METSNVKISYNKDDIEDYLYNNLLFESDNIVKKDDGILSINFSKNSVSIEITPIFIADLKRTDYYAIKIPLNRLLIKYLEKYCYIKYILYELSRNFDDREDIYSLEMSQKNTYYTEDQLLNKMKEDELPLILGVYPDGTQIIKLDDKKLYKLEEIK